MRNYIFRIFKNLGLLRLISNFSNDELVVLNIHRVSDETNPFFPPLSTFLFESLLVHLQEKFMITTFGDVHFKSSKPKLILSFDDGYKDFVDNALPILKKFSHPANHNLVNECLNGEFIFWTEKLNLIFEEVNHDLPAFRKLATEINLPFTKGSTIHKIYLETFKYLLSLTVENRNTILKILSEHFPVIKPLPLMMNWEDAKYCLNNDIEIGSHSYSHASFINENDDQLLAHEITDSIIELEQKLNTKINIFSFPNSSIGDGSRHFVEKENIKYSLLVNDKRNKISQLKDINLINRIYIMNETTDEALFRIHGFHKSIRNLIRLD